MTNSKGKCDAHTYWAVIELAETCIALGELDKTKLKKVERFIQTAKRGFADLFVGGVTEIELIFPDLLVEVWPYWLVAGQPRQQSKAEAQEWMAEGGQSWDGSTQKLRDAVRRALHRNKPVPDGYFGLHVERTVKIQKIQRQVRPGQS